MTTNQRLRILRVQEVVAQDFGLTVKQLVSQRRWEPLMFARHVAIYLCRDLLQCSWSEISRQFRKKAPGSAYLSWQRCQEIMEAYPKEWKRVSDLGAKLHSEFARPEFDRPFQQKEPPASEGVWPCVMIS